MKISSSPLDTSTVFSSNNKLLNLKSTRSDPSEQHPDQAWINQREINYINMTVSYHQPCFIVKNPLKRKVSHKTKPHINTARVFPYDNQNTFIKSFDTIISVYSLKTFPSNYTTPKLLPLLNSG